MPLHKTSEREREESAQLMGSEEAKQKKRALNAFRQARQARRKKIRGTQVQRKDERMKTGEDQDFKTHSRVSKSLGLGRRAPFLCSHLGNRIQMPRKVHQTQTRVPRHKRPRLHCISCLTSKRTRLAA